MNTSPVLFRHLSPEDFAAFGVDHMAYVKPVLVNGVAAFSIHAADGTPLTVLPDRDVASAAVRQNDLEPVSVH